MNAIRINCLLHVTRTIDNDNDKGRTIGKVMGVGGGEGSAMHGLFYGSLGVHVFLFRVAIHFFCHLVAV
jgi:hypothetical protein